MPLTNSDIKINWKCADAGAVYGWLRIDDLRKVFDFG